MRRALLIVGSSAVLVIVLVLVVGVAQVLRQPSTSDVRRLADMFEAPATWVLVDESARGRAPFCADGSCPSISRRWELEAPPDMEQLRDLVGGDDVAIDRACRPYPNTSGAFAPICSAEATRGDLELAVRILGPAPERPRPFGATLVVKPS